MSLAVMEPYAESDEEADELLQHVQNAPLLPGQHAIPVRIIDDHEHEAICPNAAPINACRTMFHELRQYLIDDVDKLVLEYVDDVFPLKSTQIFALSSSSSEGPTIEEALMTSESEVLCLIANNNCAKLFDLRSGQFTTTFSTSSKLVAAKFMNLETVKLLVTSSWSHSSDSTQVWDASTGQCLHTLKSDWMPLFDVMRVQVLPGVEESGLVKKRPSYRLRLVTASASKEEMTVYECDQQHCFRISSSRITPPDEWLSADDSEIPQLAIVRQQYAVFIFPCTLDHNFLFYELYLLPGGQHVGGGHIILSEAPNPAALSACTIRALDYNKGSDNEHADFPDLGISAPEGMRLYRLKIPASAPVSRPFASAPPSPDLRAASCKPVMARSFSYSGESYTVIAPLKVELENYISLRWPFPSRISFFGALPEWPRLVATDNSGNVLIWDARTGAEVYYMSFVHCDMNRVFFLPSPTGRTLLTVGRCDNFSEWKLWERCYRS